LHEEVGLAVDADPPHVWHQQVVGPDQAVRAAGLTKVYPARRDVPEFRAIDGIGFELRSGETFGFLGPNGAGNSVAGLWLSWPAGRGGWTDRRLAADDCTGAPI
jgi:ABC-type glutathione transport system ATPase component